MVVLVKAAAAADIVEVATCVTAIFICMFTQMTHIAIPGYPMIVSS